MAHKAQKDFCLKIKNRFPKLFEDGKVIDCGSLDINGNNRYLFTNCEYTGVDVGAGNNVDVVSPIHELTSDDDSFDFVISTEMLEHDIHYEKSLMNMGRMLKPGCMLLFTCATTGRREHGTRRTTPQDAPLLSGEWSDYYKNVTETDVRNIDGFLDYFDLYEFSEMHPPHDLQFLGIKK